MTADLIDNYVWRSAGFGFRADGIYALDFGWEMKVADWAETDARAAQYVE